MVEKKVNLYRLIKEIADAQQEESLYRTELETILGHEGYSFGYLEISNLVREAYEYFDKDRKIRSAFIDQSTGRSLVDSVGLVLSLQSSEPKVMKNTMEQCLEITHNSLSELDSLVSDSASLEIVTAGRKLLDVVKGKAGIVKIQNHATHAFQQFQGIVDSYEHAKNDVEYLLSDFAYVRNNIIKSYRKYSSQLLDVFGDRIRVVAPEIFDFNKIEWLDVTTIYKDNELEFHTLMDSSYEIMSLVSQSFQSRGQNVVHTLSSQGVSREVKGVLVAFEVFSHYAEAQVNTNALKRQFNLFVSKLLKDREWIVADLERLYAIYKSINDVALYKAQTFLNRQKEVLESGMSELIETLYDTPELKALNDERDAVLEQFKQVEDKLASIEASICTYQANAEQYKHTIDNLQDIYNGALFTKPKKPSIVANAFTFGKKRKKYRVNLSLWHNEYGQAIVEYQEAQSDYGYFTDAIKELRKNAEKLKGEIEQLNTQLNRLNENILQVISPNEELRAIVAKNLKDIVMMLRLAREIAGTKVDDRLLKAVRVDYNNKFASNIEEDEKKIDEFIAQFSESARELTDSKLHVLEKQKEEIVDHKDLLVEEQALLLANQEEMLKKASPDDRSIVQDKESPVDFERRLLENAEMISEVECKEALVEEIKLVANSSKDAIESLSHLMGSYLKLIQTNELNRKDREEYSKALSPLKEEFQKIIQESNKKGDLLREVVTKVNLASDRDTLSKAFKELSDGEISLSDGEVKAFLDGRYTIEL